MRKLAVLLVAVSALALVPFRADAQNLAPQWGAVSISLEGGVWSVQNAPSAQAASNSALASCWNHTKKPNKCIVGMGMGALWLAAGRCVHRTPSGMFFTRTGVNGGPNEAAAKQNVIALLIQDGNVKPSECAVMGAFSATTGMAAAPAVKQPAGESF